MAPVRFLSTLNRKLRSVGKEITFVDTWKYRASQYDHVADTYTPVTLNTRWKFIGGYKVRCDLYSAFLLMNTASATAADRELCIRTFDVFMESHNLCIAFLTDSGVHKPAVFGF